MTLRVTEHIRCECTSCNNTVYISSASDDEGLKYCMNCGEDGIEVYPEDEEES